MIRDQFRAYRATLQLDRRRLLERFEIVDMARKVVGVGSVGTRAFIVLLQGRDAEDPLFLQIKEATASVLEDHLPKSRFAQPGERVVQGQRMMQAVSDIFLGWTKGAEEDRYFYWRQLRDMKGSTDVESMRPAALAFYAGMCGWTLARAHARSGDPVAIAGVPGQQRRLRPVGHRFLAALRRPERARLRGLHQGDPVGTARSAGRRLNSPGTGATPAAGLGAVPGEITPCRGRPVTWSAGLAFSWARQPEAGGPQRLSSARRAAGARNVQAPPPVPSPAARKDG